MIATREFFLPANHPALSGHFPGHPVVPGVILLSWCEMLAGELVSAPITVCAWNNIKFVRPLSPAQTCSITIACTVPGKAAFRIERGEHLIAHGNLEWLSAAS